MPLPTTLPPSSRVKCTWQCGVVQGSANHGLLSKPAYWIWVNRLSRSVLRVHGVHLKAAKGHPRPIPPLGSESLLHRHCVLILSCRKWGPSSCVLCPTALPQEVGPPPVSTANPHGSPRKIFTPCSTAPAPTVKQPPTPAPGLWALLAHLPHTAEAPMHPMQPRLSAPSTACRHHRGLPLPQAHIGPRVLCPHLLEEMIEEEIAQEIHDKYRHYLLCPPDSHTLKFKCQDGGTGRWGL